jgi:hypothetical protein
MYSPFPSDAIDSPSGTEVGRGRCEREEERREEKRKGNEPSGASSVKNGPRTLLSVAPPSVVLLSASTSADIPSTSERRTNSWRSGVHIWPVRVRNWIAVIHSSVVMLQYGTHPLNLRGLSSLRPQPPRDQRERKNVLGLGNKFVKLAYEILEDELHSSVLTHAPQHRTK